MTSSDSLQVTHAVPEGLASRLSESAESFTAGFHDIRMEDIAKASGIPRATLYYHFSGKDEVLTFLLRAMLADLKVSVAAAADVEGDTNARLASVVHAQLNHLAANPGTGQLLLSNLGKAGQLPVIAAGIDEGFHAPVRRILLEADDLLVDLDVEVVTTALFGAVTIVGFQGLVSSGRIDVERVARAIVGTFWSGITRADGGQRRHEQGVGR
ncbi:MAG TPA: TetR/AcrR family transcriptional regulator [Mycobacteriales bacterium]|jgi:AcrR family transcriptional regulator|nr:TetR/AcrR family transcriptional regulator [Mycobacteriales bacterium]HWC36404.1 TetR/AcrR family transcriptional regulator [Mycobacteriales bacterium]